MSRSVTQTISLVRHLGVDWCVFRLGYALRKRSGALKRTMPVQLWDELPVPELTGAEWFGEPVSVGPGAVLEADEILGGVFRLFSHHRVNAGLLPQWERNQLSGECAPSERHWSEIEEFKFGDVKAVWELSRFPWAIALARAFRLTGDDRYAERFWILFEHWAEANPPNRGPNWMCGQEATFRLIAASFAWQVLRRTRATTERRRAIFSRFVLATGKRISGNLRYALSQSNNHGISECIGLITAAALLAPDAETVRWRRRGTAMLDRQLNKLVYSDGGFSQHSAIYHRVLLHDLLWAMMILRQSGMPASATLISAAKRAYRFALDLVDPTSGELPLYGANDGANVLTLADSDFLDFRPTLQGMATALGVPLPFGPGLWNELPQWLAAGSVRASRESRTAAEGMPERTSHYYRDAGCWTATNGDCRAFLRCPTRFKHRPGHVDMLHVDIVWRGQRIAHDAGTYAYNTIGPFSPGLADAACHNTIIFGDKEPLEKVSRFLYLPWPSGVVRTEDNRCTIQASHNAWSRWGYRHVRTVRPEANGGIAVEDVVSSRHPVPAVLHWLLADFPFTVLSDCVVLRTPVGSFTVAWDVTDAVISTMRADPQSRRGWWSPCYQYAAPAVSLQIRFQCGTSTRVLTRFVPDR